MRPRRFLVIGATGKTGLVPDDCVHLRTYLLAYDLARERLYDRRRTELLLAAGVLAETLIQGRVEEHDRRVRVLAPARADDDRTLRSALERIAIKPHGWSQWVRTLRTLAMSEVEATIAADGAALRNQGPRWRRLRIPVMTAHTDRVVEYQHRAREILTGQAPIDEIDRRDAAMTVIAAQGRIPAVLLDANFADTVSVSTRSVAAPPPTPPDCSVHGAACE